MSWPGPVSDDDDWWTIDARLSHQLAERPSGRTACLAPIGTRWVLSIRDGDDRTTVNLDSVDSSALPEKAARAAEARLIVLGHLAVGEWYPTNGQWIIGLR